MKKYPLVCWPQHPILRTVCDEVTVFDKEIKELAEDLLELMRLYEWVWIAAPQIWITKRMAAFTQRDMTKKDRELVFEDVMINPVVLSFSKETEIAEEWCLSLPWMKGHVERPSEITIQYYTMNWEKKIMTSQWYNARIILHEMDHLDGVLFIDKLA